MTTFVGTSVPSVDPHPAAEPGTPQRGLPSCVGGVPGTCSSYQATEFPLPHGDGSVASYHSAESEEAPLEIGDSVSPVSSGRLAPDASGGGGFLRSPSSDAAGILLAFAREVAGSASDMDRMFPGCTAAGLWFCSRGCVRAKLGRKAPEPVDQPRASGDTRGLRRGTECSGCGDVWSGEIWGDNVPADRRGSPRIGSTDRRRNP
jgi:hypothetical protein